MARARKKKRRSARKLASFAIFLVSAGVAFYGRYDLLWGGKGYLLGRIDFYRIENQSDLPSPSDSRVRPAKVVGIPDYKNSVRLPYNGKTLTCYRMVDFGNRLVVCSDKGLVKPRAIDEIIKERTIRGRLERLSRGPLEVRLRQDFQGLGGIRVQDDAFVLCEDKSPLPSPVKFGAFTLCLILCCFSAYRLIK